MMTAFNNTQAMTEGWAISACIGVEENWRLEKIDEQDKFDSDINAWLFVGKKAIEGSVYHIRALKFLEVNEPAEFELIQNHVCLFESVVSLTDLFVQLKETV